MSHTLVERRNGSGADRATPERWLSRAYLVLAGTGTAIFAYPGFSHAVRDLDYTLVSGSLVVAILVGVRRYRPHAPAAWYLMALAQGLWVVADTTFHWQQHVLHRDTFPTISDLFFLLGYPIFAAGLFRLAKERSRIRGALPWASTTRKRLRPRFIRTGA